MINKFFKTVGKGLLYVLAFPFLIVVVLLFGIVGILIFIFLLGKSIVLFFKGKTIFSDYSEDIEAKKILDAGIQPTNNEERKVEEDNGPLSLYPSDSNMYKSEFHKPQDEIIEEIKEPEEVIAERKETNTETQEIHLESEKEKEEVIGTFTPLSSNKKDDKK